MQADYLPAELPGTPPHLGKCSVNKCSALEATLGSQASSAARPEWMLASM